MAMICAKFKFAKPQGAPEPTELFSFSMMPEHLRLNIHARTA
jgi:hypothetical protein